jgi:hypothetical protein
MRCIGCGSTAVSERSERPLKVTADFAVALAASSSMSAAGAC